MRYALILLLALVASCRTEVESVDVLSRRAAAGDGRAMETLVSAMASPERERAVAAYRAVVKLDEGAVDILIRNLTAASAAVVEASAAALGSIGRRDALPSLVEALDPARKRRYAAAWALGELGDERAIPHLVRVLEDGDGHLRKTAVRSLVKIGGPVEGQVLQFLRNGPDRAGERAAIMILGELRSTRAVPDLAAIPGVNRDAAAWALGRSGDHRALGPLLEMLTDGRWQVRRHAAEALGYLEDPSAAAALEAALEDRETVVREWAARSLETLTGRRVVYRDHRGEMVAPYNLYR